MGSESVGVLPMLPFRTITFVSFGEFSFMLEISFFVEGVWLGIEGEVRNGNGNWNGRFVGGGRRGRENGKGHTGAASAVGEGTAAGGGGGAAALGLAVFGGLDCCHFCLFACGERGLRLLLFRGRWKMEEVEGRGTKDG